MEHDDQVRKNLEKGSEESEDEYIKQIPYGISDYELIRTENYYYVDKTFYLKNLTKAGRYLFLIRPRRFGKSLFISLMESYFDVFYKGSRNFSKAPGFMTIPWRKE